MSETHEQTKGSASPGPVVMTAAQMARALSRMVHEILERNGGAENLALVGVRTRGYPLALRLASLIEKVEGKRPPTGAVDVTFFRDDFRLRAKAPQEFTDIPFAVDDKNIVLVDDVFFTGRTTRAAMETVMEFGRPRTIQLAVLVDRNHRELPIHPDYVAKRVETALDEVIRVRLKEIDGEDQVLLVRGGVTP
ncbi:MAG TPA: bifunctional pyr operon transcriptional regulator/uracil phosphoribosyltransferase PyrR [Candidatus Latescibacteria bacterium]|nr:bifunctional pyr operon transcriptional regulator/uracil phosphoribosyltransferase PyrR [Candidatus Latescibacterota bacterium]